MKKTIALFLCAAVFMTVFLSGGVYAADNNSAVFRLETDADAQYLKRGDEVNVTVCLSTDYIVGSFSAIVYYDNRFFEPSLGGEAYTKVQKGTAAAVSDGFIRMIDNPASSKPEGWNVWQNGTITGRVNTSGQMPFVPYYPPEWLESATQIKSEYEKYDYVEVLDSYNSASPSGGYCVTANPEQALFAFSLRVKDDAPLTDGFDAKIFMTELSFRTDESVATKNQHIYATKFIFNDSFTGSVLYGLDYSLKDAVQSFRIVADDFTPDEPNPVCVEHIWDNGTVTKEAKLFKKGEITYTCTVCGETYTVQTDSLFTAWFHSTIIYRFVIKPIINIFKGE